MKTSDFGKAIERSGSGLSEALFEHLEKLRDGKVDVAHSREFCNVAKSIIDLARVRLEYEKLRLASEIPANLGEMKLIPAIPTK